MNSIDIQQVRIHRHGDAAVLQPERAQLPPPGPGELRVRQQAVGVNFVDVYHRTGLYPLPALPATLGVEAAGIVEAVGPGVDGFVCGQRVAYAGPPVGGYASARNLSASQVLALPDSVGIEQAAGALLRGITAHMLLSRVRTLQAGDTLLVHAAAGGLGLILVQWAKALGARVIGTVGNRAKAELALAHGLDRAVLYREEDFVAAAREFSGGAGVDYLIDGIGGDTLARSLSAVRPFGTVASIGQVAGDIGMIDSRLLGPAHAVALIRPGVFAYMRDPLQYREGAEATLTRLATGMKAVIGRELPLADAAHAHRLLEAGDTTGALLLRP